MPRVILLRPFIRHYAGTVFELPDDIGISGWPEDERLREKQNFSDKRTYALPDAGNGQPAELLLSDTILCPADIFDGMDLTTGPCRITSVSRELEDPALDRPAAGNLPEGMGKVRLMVEGAPAKNKIMVSWPGAELSAAVFSRPEAQAIPSVGWNAAEKTLDFSGCRPGFYLVRLSDAKQGVHEFTLIKCFPLVVNVEERGRRFTTQATVW